MRMKKYQNRKESLLSNKEDYVRNATVMFDCNADDVRIVGCKITEQEARDKVRAALNAKDAAMQLGVHYKLVDALKTAAEPIVHKEYYSVIASWFHISKIEYDYSYRLNDNVINMSPVQMNVAMNFCAAVETLDGRYRQSIAGKRTDLSIWDDLLESDCVEDFEDGFTAHELVGEDEIRESKESMRILNTKLNAQVKEWKQDELGSSRRITELRVIDKEYTYNTKVLAAPFYIFNYDLGNKIVTISVDAYSGVVGTPVVNNPLGLALLAKPCEEPYFSVLICIVCGIVCIGIGAALYALGYYLKKMKFNHATAKDAPKYSFDELKQLI